MKIKFRTEGNSSFDCVNCVQFAVHPAADGRHFTLRFYNEYRSGSADNVPFRAICDVVEYEQLNDVTAK